MGALFKSEVGKKEILGLYDAKLAELQIDHEHQIVDTSFGQTNILVTGSASLPPLIMIHGSNGCAPIALETYPNLSKRFQVFAVDVLAQPNKSAETRLSMKDNSYGVWMNEIMASLDIQNVTLVGFSFGGLIILKTLINNEKRVKEAFLAAPAYIVNGNPLRALFKVFIPMKRYMKTKRISYVEKFLKELFSDRDEFAVQYLSKVFIHFDMDFTPVPVISKKDAQAIITPITIFGAGEDIMFPGKKMLKRASKIFPNLKESILLEGSKHVQGRADNERIEGVIFGE